MTPDAPLLLQAQDLTRHYPVRRGLFRPAAVVRALDGVSLSLQPGRTLAVVGESGCGKSTLARLLTLIEPPSGGTLRLRGEDATEPAVRTRMRREVQMVFQNPYASLNPRFTIAQALTEPMEIHQIGADHAERIARASALLKKVGLDESALHKYPHEFSGGQRQRIAIARCLTLNPEVLVLDESVSALDVSVQAQVLNLLKDLQDEFGLSYIFISHDLAVVKFIADEVLVMQHGDVVEQADAQELLRAPQQDYTRRLLGAVPRGYQGPADTASPAAA